MYDPPADDIDIDQIEEPLLIHPCRENSAQHLRFGAAGTIAALDDKGKHTIRVFGLDRGELSDLRKARQEEATTAYGMALASFIIHGVPIERSMEAYAGRKAVFSSAVVDYLQAREQELLAKCSTSAVH